VTFTNIRSTFNPIPIIISASDSLTLCFVYGDSHANLEQSENSKMSLSCFRTCNLRGVYHRFRNVNVQLQEQGLPIFILSPGLGGTHDKCRDQRFARYLHVSHRTNAGHSKWQNIKHIKAANDRERGMKSNLLVQKVQQVLLKNPEKDPKLNTELANLIKWARTNNIPNETVEKTIDRQVKLRDPKAITVIDGRGPSNTGVIMECFSLKPQHTRTLLQGIVKKYGFNLNSPALDLFEHSGIIDVSLPGSEADKASADPDRFCLDKYIDIAIEASAEEVTLEMDSDGPYLQFKCSPFDLPRVHKHLEESGLTVVNQERVYIPTTMVSVSKDFEETLEKMSDKLDLHPDVIKYYFNVTPDTS
ncbi:hypothetical protein EGW08_008123, partial [Elysia chlorotica]